MAATISRQLKYKIKKYRAGACVNCGHPRGESPFKRICAACGEARKKSRRSKLGFKAWKPGSPGRPPLSAAKSQSETEGTK